MSCKNHPLFNRTWCTVAVLDGHTYLFQYNLQNYQQALRIAGRFAADSRLNFTWHEAAVVCGEIRKVMYAAQQVLASTVAASGLDDEIGKPAKHSRRFQ